MARKKLSQYLMIWLLPLIIIGGLFWPLLGYIVFFMMVFFLVLSYFKGRFWCANLCPRGAFCDIVLHRVSAKRPIPAFITSRGFRWTVFAVFMAFFITQFILSEKDIPAIGLVFVRMCLVTTLITIIIGMPGHQRMWCAFCPMGTLQSAIHKLKKKN